NRPQAQARPTSPCSAPPSVHPADAGIAAHPAGAGRGLLPLRRRAIGMRRECGILLADALLAAGWTIDVRRFGRAADQLLKLRIAILALILVDWHSYLFGHHHT